MSLVNNNNGGDVGDFDEDDGGDIVDGKDNVEDSSPTINQTVRIKKFIHHGAFTWDIAKVKIELENPIENIGAMIVRQAAFKLMTWLVMKQ
ncbi:hypothetical protein F2Q68_00024901 [Brassica cretica]|uniref:Uncharacterized protein n=1 Tax=Brassica cretica TaxID=69181 RepID=A0A8S9I7X3_BRACR|nr:hypothetical protein F2Q68_00024901 [Brassica cretica]